MGSQRSQELRDNRPVFDPMSGMVGDDADKDLAVAAFKEKGLTISGVRITQVGLVMPEPDVDLDMEQSAYSEIGEVIMLLRSGIQWCLGDWFRFGRERKWGEDYERLAEQFGYDVTTLYNFSYVCNAFPHFSSRDEKLSFSHHRLAAMQPEEKRAELLQYARENNLSVHAFDEYLKELKRQGRKTPKGMSVMRRRVRALKKLIVHKEWVQLSPDEQTEILLGW